MFRKILALSTFCLNFAFLPLQAQTFLEELKESNKYYRDRIYFYEQRLVGQVPVAELDKINKERFSLIAGVGRQIRQDGPNEQEWYEITESVWQHAACLLENENAYDDKTGFKEVGFKSEASSLFQLIIGGQNFEELDQAHQGNALALFSGTFYVLELLTSRFPKIVFWDVAGLGEYKPILPFGGEFKAHIDGYFQEAYKSLKAERSTEENTTATYGHFTFFLSGKEMVKPRFTAIVRTYVTRGKKKQDQSPFYGVRVASKAEIHCKEQTRWEDSIFKAPELTDFETPLKSLVFTFKNTRNLPIDKADATWLTVEDFKRNKENLVEFGFKFKTDKQGNCFQTLFWFTLKKLQEGNLFCKSTSGEYIYLWLDQWMIYPGSEAYEYKQNLEFL